MVTIAQKEKERITYGIGAVDTQKLPHWNQLKVGALTFRDEYEGDFFMKVLELAFTSLLENYKVYLVFMEPFASPVTRLRSHVKLFKLHRHKLEDENLVEEEVVVADGYSVMTAVLELKPSNLALVLEHLLRGSFIFGIIAEQPLSNSWKIDFLHQIVNQATTYNDRLRLDLPRILNDLVVQDLILFRLYANQDDREFLECWGAEPLIEQLLSQLRTDLGTRIKIYPILS